MMSRKVIVIMLMALMAKQAASTENPFDEPKLTISATNLSLPKIHTSESGLAPYEMRNTWGLALELDLPILPHVHSGFFVRYLISPKSGDIGGILDFGAFIKPMLTMQGSLGHLSFYPLIGTGLSVTFSPILYKLFPVEQDVNNEFIRQHINVFGGLFNASAKMGVEYFPWSQLGFFAEAGFGYWYFLHQINKKLFEPSFNFFSYHLTGLIVDAGIKFVF